MEERSRAQLFLNYRRQDSEPILARLLDTLGRELLPGQVFADTEITPGDNWRERLRLEVGQCSLFFCLIGKRWFSIRGLGERRRLDEPEDWVRFELEMALERVERDGFRLIPILLDGARMPRSEELPESIRRLAGLQAITLRLRDWQADMNGLLEVLQSAGFQFFAKAEAQLPPAPEGLPPTSATRRAEASTSRPHGVTSSRTQREGSGIRRPFYAVFLSALLLVVAAVWHLMRPIVHAGGSGTLVQGVLEPLSGLIPHRPLNRSIPAEDIGSNEAPFFLVQEKGNLGLRSAKLNSSLVTGEAYQGWVFVGVCIGRDRPAWFVHRDNPVEFLSRDLLKAALFCADGRDPMRITWATLGVPEEFPISEDTVRLIVPGRQEAGLESGTVDTVKHALGVGGKALFCYPVEGQSIIWLHRVPSLVGGDPNALGVSAGLFEDNTVKRVPIVDSSGVEIDLIRGLWLYLAFTREKKPAEEVVSVVKWFLSEGGQRSLEMRTRVILLTPEERGAEEAWFASVWDDVREDGPLTRRALEDAQTGSSSILHSSIDAR